MNVNQYDIVLDVLVVNQTPDTLQGLTLELATLGDLKLVEKPTPCTVGPHDFISIKVCVCVRVYVRVCVIVLVCWCRPVLRCRLLKMASSLGTLVSSVVRCLGSLLDNSSCAIAAVYDILGSTSDRNCVVLNNVHIDVMDYIQPATCTEVEFRKMWVEFEWENKITVNTNIKDLMEYLEHLLTNTNMRCLTPKQVRQM